MHLSQTRDLRRRWRIIGSTFGPAPAGFNNEVAALGFPYGNQAYRNIRIEGPTPANEDFEPSEYAHRTARGVIFAMDINRTDGPHWCDIAMAQYVMDHPADTLRSIYFHDVINPDTRRLIVNHLYTQRMPLRFEARDNAEAEVPITWTFGTPEYQAILGTTFGKGVCALLATYFPRGTMIVSRVVTWKYADLQIRFDIEPIEYMAGIDI